MQNKSSPVEKAKRGGETARHKTLKTLAFLWARDQGLRVAASEVSFPHRRIRVDVAAFKPGCKVPWKNLPESFGTTAIFECKQARSDLIKDNARCTATRTKLATLFERKAKLESLLKVHLPHLARGETLFPEIDFHDFQHIRHEGYEKTVRAIRIAQNKLEGSVKFDQLLGYHLANLHYIVTAPDIVEEHEIPLDCGWLVAEGEGLVLRRPPTWIETSLGDQFVFLQRIAASGTAAAFRNQS